MEVAHNLKRTIGADLYWPLTQLDLLNDNPNPSANSNSNNSKSSFVCSQSTTIFDNLINQTFTVVNSLQLSQYNDFVQSKTSGVSQSPSSPPSPASASSSSSFSDSYYNLYACIVGADIRHNYATLGVNFRQAPGHLPLELSKRLHAKSILAARSTAEKHMERVKSKSMRPDRVDQDNYANFDLLRENQLKCEYLNIDAELDCSSIALSYGSERRVLLVMQLLQIEVP